GHVVDARLRAATAMAEDVGRGGEARRQVAAVRCLAHPEAARAVAEAVVPLRPAGGEAAELVAADSDVPWLGDHLGPGEHRVLAQRYEEGSVPFERGAGIVATVAPQRGREIEAEPVDMHLLDPVAQRVHHELEGWGIGKVEAVS